VSLGEACRALGVDHHRPHTALGDVGATWEMVHKLQTLLDGLHGWPIGRRDVLNLDPMLLMRLYQWQLRELRARPDAWQTRSWWPAWLELRP
jgi:DNA polymerase III epsilon subunit-like protein